MKYKKVEIGETYWQLTLKEDYSISLKQVKINRKDCSGIAEFIDEDEGPVFSSDLFLTEHEALLSAKKYVNHCLEVTKSIIEDAQVNLKKEEALLEYINNELDKE